MEGLLLESSPTYPTYFYISFHFNTSTWWPGFPVTVPERNVEKGIKYFKLFNVKYFVAAQAQTKADFAKLKITAEYENDEFSVYKINKDSRIANRLEGEVSVLEAKNPLMQTVQNYPYSLDKTIEIKTGRPALENAIRDLEQAEVKTVPLEGKWSANGQSYEVMQTGASNESPQKILFKISHFPNWKTNTGDQVRLVTPNLMMVETKSPTLILTYSAGLAERLSLFISIVSLAVLIWSELKRSHLKRT